MSNPWAPKSIRDDADHEPLVVRAVQLRLVLYLLFFAIGLGAGYVTFLAMERGAEVGELFGIRDERGLLAGAAWVLLVGGVFGELALMLWLCLCRYRLGLSAGQATAALRAGVIPSFTLARLYDRLYPK